MSMLTVLFTCALGDYMESTIACVKNNFEGREIKVVGTDIRDVEYFNNGIDVFYKSLRCDDFSYIDQIFEICVVEGVNVVIPTNTLELEKFEKNKKRFEEAGIAVATAGSGISLVNSKDNLMRLMERIGMDHVPSEVIWNVNQAVTFINTNGSNKPYCVKQLNSCGARGFKILSSLGPSSILDKGTNRIPISALKELLDKQGPMLIQEYLTGKEMTVDMLCDNGKVLYSIVKHNKQMVNGVAQISKIAEDPYSEQICSRIVEAASLCGNIGFDVKYSQYGKPFIIDCNPRLTATVALANKVGINLPYLGIKYALKEQIPEVKPNGKKPVCVRKTKDYFFDD